MHELTQAPRTLRWFNLWLILGWLLVALVIYLSLTPHPIEIDMEQGDKLGHMLGYMAMMVWFAQLYSLRVHVWWGLGFVAMGVALEYVQGCTGYRTFDYFDMLADAIGVLAGWWLGGTGMAHLLSRLERHIKV
jgi:VanZ family protein